MNCVDDRLVVLVGILGSGRTRLMRAQYDALDGRKEQNVIWLSSAHVSGNELILCDDFEEILKTVLDKASLGERYHVYVPNIELLAPEDLACLESFIALANRNIHVVVSAASGLDVYFRSIQPSAESTTITYRDLALTKEEVRNVALSHNSSLNQEYISRLFELTLGWPVLVETCLANASTIRELNELSSTHNPVCDCIIDGLFKRLSVDEVEFLMSVCWLDEFDANLAGRITKSMFSAHIIEHLQSQNVLVKRSAARKTGGYCCHPFLVFSIRSYAYANVSSHDFKKRMIEIITCYEDNGEHLKAFQTALTSGMYDHAFHVLVENIFAVLPRVDVETLRHLADSYNHENGSDECLYYLITAWIAFLSGEHRRARFLLSKAERFKRDTMNQPRIRGAHLLGQTIQMGCDVFQGKYENAIALGCELIERMGGPQLFMRCTIMHSMGEAYLRLGMYREAKDAFLRASADARVSGRYEVELICESEIAWLKFTRGNLDASSNVILRALARAEKGHYHQGWSLGVLYVGLARVYLQWCEMDKTHQYLDRAAEVLSPDNNRDAYLESKVTLARLLELEGKHEESYEQIIMAHEMTLWDSVPRGVDLMVIITFADILVTRGRYDEAIQLIDGMLEKASPRDDFYRIHADIIRARVFVLEHADIKGAMAILEKALKRANETGQMLLATFCKVRLACIYRTAGRAQDGINLMTQALEECAEDGRIYTFTPPLPFQNTLIYEIAFPTSSNLIVDKSRKSARNHARKVIDRLKDWDFLEHTIKEDETEDENRYAELTVREREVCDLLKQGKTRRQIADELGLKLNTVRTHIRNVYKKLDIHERSML